MDFKTKERIKENLTIAEAIENLTTIAEMEIDEKTPIGILQNKKITTREEDFTYKEIDWLFPEVPENFIDNIKPTYRVVLEYFKELYNNPETDWEDEKTIHGLRSIMSLAEDAASRIKEYFVIFHKNVEFTKTQEFKDVENYFREYILKKLPTEIEGKEAWEKEWPKNKEAVTLDADKSGLRNFDTIAKDEEYELFYIKNENDVPFLSGALIKNLKIYVRLEEGQKQEESPFVNFRKLEEKDMQLSSRQILNMLDHEIHEFYKFQFNCVKNKLAGSLNRSFMALMLAANPNNLMKIKPCHEYFKDFQMFLRTGFETEDYRKVVTRTQEKEDSNVSFLTNLVNKVAFSVFNRLGGVKEEVIGFIHLFIKEGKDKEKLSSKESVWNFMEESDDNIRSFIKKFPNYSLLKCVDTIRSEEEKVMAFDPLVQGNIPEKLYELSFAKNKMSILHLPCPTKQEIITKAEIVNEFLGFLRTLKEEKTSHLLINLQDRLSWRENARSMALEEIEEIFEFKSSLNVVALSKDSNFYHQNEDYFAASSAYRFIDEFKKVLLNNEEGFFIPLKLKTKELIAFVDSCMTNIHEFFFLEKSDLARPERLDFIEIFYHFFILKLIEMTKPGSISFTCKDAIDTGSVLSASFYSFIKMLEKSNLTKEDKDYLLWLIYSPALLIRERAVNPIRLTRSLSAMALFDAHKDHCKQKFLDLFDKSFLNSLKVNPKE
jgi:hypothetical protein